MARRLTHPEIDRIDLATQESGLEVLQANGHRPRRLRVRMPASRKTADLIVYIWRIRPGGGGPGVRPDNERRVQTTRPGDSDFLVVPNTSTLLLGYEPDEDVYAAWDLHLRRWTRNPPGHPNGSPVASPSAQTRQSKLDEAQRAGIAFHVHPVDERLQDGTTQEREETVANFRPDHFGAYLTWLNPRLVPTGQSPPARAFKRHRVATQRLARDARFVKTVIDAYGERCCFCGFGAGIIEAAHVRPVADGGPDTVTNGIGLCPTHHRLFDKGFILISPGALAVTANDQLMRTRKVPARDRQRVAEGISPSPFWPRIAAHGPEARFLRRHRTLHR